MILILNLLSAVRAIDPDLLDLAPEGDISFLPLPLVLGCPLRKDEAPARAVRMGL